MPQHLMWTVLPNGFLNGKTLQVAVFLSPRLTHPAPGVVPLSKFPDFTRWPELVAGMRFAIEFDGGPTVPAYFDANVLDNGLWNDLCNQGVTVGSHAFSDRSNRFVWCYPASSLLARIRYLYQTAAENYPTDRPTLDDPFLNDLRAIGRHIDQYDDFVKNFEAAAADSKYVDLDVIAPSPQARAATEFLLANRYYRRPGTADTAAAPKRIDPPVAPTLDFHSLVGFLGDYPGLLRPLGIVVDLTLPFNPALAKYLRARVVIESSELVEGIDHVPSHPWTNYELKAPHRFLARPRDNNPDLADGMLQVDNVDFYTLTQLDVDGAVLKTSGFAANLHRRGPVRTNDEHAALPALQAGGFSVLRRRREERLVQHLELASQHQTDYAGDTEFELFAEDVTRGYRADVRDSQTDSWHSLHHRAGEYLLHDDGEPTPIEVGRDEGYVKSGSVSSVTDSGPDADLYYHESVFGWDGWSLSAPRPGATIRAVKNDATGGQDETAEVIPPEPKTDMPLSVAFRAQPGTLPRLRYGVDYQVRARLVDLAGNSLNENTIIADHASPITPYLRFEPVPSPAVVPRTRYTEGESLMRMVIRSTLGETPETYVAMPHVTAALSGQLHVYAAQNERHLAPPKSPQLMAELHGEFDQAMGAGKDYTSWLNIGKREEGSFLDTQIVDTATGQPTLPVPGISVMAPPGETPASLPIPKGDPLPTGHYVVHDTDDLLLPYLPDSFSRGVSFTALPGDAGTRLQVWPSGDYPDRRPIRIAIEGGTNPPTWIDSQGLLRVQIPQAEVVVVRLSSYLDQDDLRAMGIWRWMSPAAQTLHNKDAIAGRHWMLTPWQPLVLVHAVEKPLEAPIVNIDENSGANQRQLGETFTPLDGFIACHAKSTGRLDVAASWTEWVDNVNEPAPRRLDGEAHVGDFDVAVTEDNALVGRSDSPSGTSPPVHQLRHEFGDTKYRRVSYRATATTRFREYFAPEILEDPARITHVGDEHAVHVPNCRRPDPPEVLYAVPTFRWEEPRVRSPIKGRRRRAARTRRGGGLRIYLDRPWYSSGDGELLGVVLYQQPFVIPRAERAKVREAAATTQQSVQQTAGASQAAGNVYVGNVMSAVGATTSSAALAEFVSQWGKDPIWGSPSPDSGPRPGDFPARVAGGSFLSLAEVPNGRVAVAGHQPVYDSVRKLWYCDIDIDAGKSYYPFVRLALTRYQPRSIPDAHLSRVVLAEFAQLTPDRAATVTIGRKRIRVTLSGVAGYNDLSANLFGAFGSPLGGLYGSRRFVVRLQKRDPLLGSSDLAWTDDGIPVEMTQRSLVDDVYTWSTAIPIPDDSRFRGGDHQYRLAIEEYELLQADQSVADSFVTDTIGFNFSGLLQHPVRSRLVYADHFLI